MNTSNVNEILTNFPILKGAGICEPKVNNEKSLYQTCENGDRNFFKNNIIRDSGFFKTTITPIPDLTAINPDLVEERVKKSRNLRKRIN